MPQITPKQLDKEVDKIWCPKFFVLMRNRIAMGHLRYGPQKGGYNMVKSLETKLKLYKETGNTELLVDIGNYAMLEFRQPSHPKAHFESLDDTAHASLK